MYYVIIIIGGTLNESIRSYLFDSKISVKNLNLEYTYIPKDKICYQDEFLNFWYGFKYISGIVASNVTSLQNLVL